MKVIKALQFATEKHSGQKRRISGDDYISHPVKVSYLLATYKRSKKQDDLIVAALLHDTLEDTDTTFDEIYNIFGPLVASLVLELTSDEDEIKIVGKNNYLKSKMSGMSSWGLTLKLVDRLANISDHPTQNYCNQTLELLEFLEKKRNFSNTQQNIVDDIRKEILGK
jgi:(p)ppGpp synthase/HD superfamily hydrolase